MFATLLAQIVARFGLTAEQAKGVVRAALGIIERTPQGIGALVDALKQAGLAGTPEDWVGEGVPALEAAKVGAVAGPQTVKTLASELHVGEAQATSILGYALPQTVGLVAPSGHAPALPEEARRFLKGDVLPPGLPADHLVRSPMGDWLLRGAIFAAALALLWWLTPHTSFVTDHAKAPAETGHADDVAAAGEGHGATAETPATTPAEPAKTEASAAHAPSVATAEATPAPAEPAKTEASAAHEPGQTTAETAQALASAGQAATDGAASPAATAPEAAQAPASPAAPAATADASSASGAAAPTASPAPAAEAGSVPARLRLREVNGTVTYGGAVPDDATAETIKSQLAEAFGADKIRGALTVNPRYAAPSWLAKLAEIIGAVRSPGFNLALNGDGLDLKALSPTVDRAALSAALAGLLPNLTITLPATSGPTLNVQGAMTALDAIKGDYKAIDVLKTLNEVAIEFPTGSAEVPADSKAVLVKAAELIKALPGGASVVIEGYTDNVGEEDFNRTLSQQRADAVRDIMIAAGLVADDVTATGYGSANPVAGNDTPDGRARNRRITYEVRPK